MQYSKCRWGKPHKRRTDWRKFFKQVFNSGIARINLYKLYPSSLKWVHSMPAIFVLFVLSCLFASFFCFYTLLPLAFWGILIFLDSLFTNKSVKIAFLSIIASFIQLSGYGLGFFSAVWKRIVLKNKNFSAFEKNFYKWSLYN